MRGYRFKTNPLDRKVIVRLALMTCDGKGLFGLGGLGFVMAGFWHCWYERTFLIDEIYYYYKRFK
ncbi:hypothetical protein RhiirB3_420908 [Rhizophagus irregularis]|nr:hypothetical protein RhiirB3_420908 [Rhizophagus irregularis]